MENSEEAASSTTLQDESAIIPIIPVSRARGDNTELKNIGDRCLVCGDRHARMHYGALTCFGCKGFFRRTLKRSTEYKCRQQGNCPVDKYERNSCRFCRFKRCLEVGMDPKAVRPDRDSTGRHYLCRTRRFASVDEPLEDIEIGEEWIRRLSVDMRTILMRLMNVEVMVNAGNTSSNATEIYPLHCGSLEDFLNNPNFLNGKKTEVSYEPYRKVEMDELVAIAHRNLLTVIDWTHHLCDSMERITTHDKFLLVRNGFTPLTVFSAATGTAKWTEDKDILCLSRLGYVPRNAQKIYSDLYHLSNGLVDRIIDELVLPLRALKLTDEEVVLMKAIIILNPQLKGLTRYAAVQIGDLRDRIQEVLYQVVREMHPNAAPSSRFGNLLLYFSSITVLGNVMYENLRNIQQKTTVPTDPMLYDLLMDNGTMMVTFQHLPLSATSSLDSTDGYHGLMYSSYSNSSVSSLISQTSASMSEFEQSSESQDDSNLSFSPYCTFPDDTFRNHPQEQQQTATDPSVNIPFPEFNATSDFIHVDQLESDPNYNMTLTPDMFTGMREALNAAHQVETTDTLSTPPNSPFGYQAVQEIVTTATSDASEPMFQIGL